VFAIATSVLASRRPAKTMAAVPVVAALSGRPAPPKAMHRSAVPGVIVFAVGLACLASSGGLSTVNAGSGPGGGGPKGGRAGTQSAELHRQRVGYGALTVGPKPQAPSHAYEGRG
jgi:hypothetical protein